MTSTGNRLANRRTFLWGSLTSGSLLISGFDKIRWAELLSTQDSDPFRGGTQTGIVDFSDESNPPMGQVLGAELDGRLFTDLSKLTPEDPVTPTGTFYVRTRASKLLDAGKSWSVQMGGVIEKPFAVTAQDLKKMERTMGLHLMECAGNTRSAHFGMLSVADWDGVPLEQALENMRLKQPGYVLISGFDHYAAESRSSWPGASWIFTLDQLQSSRAFLATKMNGQPLSLDHGAPVRLVVPGWYGCACIKWVNEITAVAADAPATSQMQEYASRTLQTGTPLLAKDYQPAVIDPAAMPIRVERWSVRGKIKYRVVGIQWGGARPVEGLEIQFNPEEEYVRVANFQIGGNDSWNFWSQPWVPQRAGKYLIRLRIKGSNIVTKRLDSGYYVRPVEIAS
jgi:DMSO/TMAO reductase YedYZ molybdopterin-dependent catalytic subunit